MYHHVAESTPSTTSVTPERFREHLAHLAANDYVVVRLVDALRAYERGRPLPQRSVAITFDDAYSSVLSEAAPELERRGWPFTVFVNTQAIDDAYRGYLSWDELRRVVDLGGDIGNHTRTHAHLVRREAGESERGWRDRVMGEITGAAERLRAEVGAAAAPVFAYPYGEYTGELKEIVADVVPFAMGQHSGALGSSTDLLAVPRFPLATGFDGLEEFALRAKARALPAMLAGEEEHLAVDARPALRLELATGDYRVEQLACYASNQGRMDVTWLDREDARLEARPTRPIAPGRTKYNCTAPSASEGGVYYWFSHLWMMRNPDGSWYAE